MDPREAKAIMSQGAIRPETARDREERRLLEEELAVSPVKGKPLAAAAAQFPAGADSAIRALGGPTVWMRRLRTIEDEIERHEAGSASAGSSSRRRPTTRTRSRAPGARRRAAGASRR